MANAMAGKQSRDVRNAEEFTREYETLSDAAVGVFMVRTREPHRCCSVLHEIAIRSSLQFKLWTCITGFQTFRAVEDVDVDLGMLKDWDTPVQAMNAETLTIVKALDAVLKESTTSGIHAIFYPHHYLDNPAVQQHIKELVRKGADSPVRVVLVVHDEVNLPPEIQDDVHVLDFKTPSHAELVDTWFGITRLADDPTSLTAITHEEVDEIVQNAIGMTDTEFATAISIACVKNRDKLNGRSEEPFTPDDFIKTILTYKVEVVKKTQILELSPSVSIESVGGMDLLKGWIRERRTAFGDEAAEFGIEPPKGMLVVGPPGTGKSLFSKAAAGIFRVPLVKLDIGKIFDKYVGNSEGRMRSALKVVESVAPCVLLLDEVDKGFGGIGGGGDSGVSQRILGTFLTWMQERDNKRAPVFTVMTANNVVGLPAELLRRGRIDEIFACTFPNERDRRDILRIHFEKRGHTVPEALIASIAEATPEYVGAELEAIVKDGLIKCFNTKSRELDPQTFRDIASGITPLSRSFAEKVKVMEEWAKNNARPASSPQSIAERRSGDILGGPLRIGGGIRRPKPGGLRGSKNLDG